MSSIKRNIFLFILILSLISNGIYGQLSWQTADKIVYIGDLVIIHPIKYRGEIQWQKSADLSEWLNITEGNSDTLKLRVDASTYFRAVITEGNCNPIYSDTLSIAAIEKKSFSYQVSAQTDSFVILDQSSPLNNIRIKFDENTFESDLQMNFAYFVDTAQIVDSLFLPLGPIVDIHVEGLEDTLIKPITIEMPIKYWSTNDPNIPVVAHYVDSVKSWEIIPIINITDSSVIFQTNHFSPFGVFLYIMPNNVYDAFTSETTAIEEFESYITGGKDFTCQAGQWSIDKLEDLKTSCYSNMIMLDLEACGDWCPGGLDKFLLNIDQHISEVFIKNIIKSPSFLKLVGVTGGVAVAIKILGGVSALLYTPCVLCIAKNSTMNPWFWGNWATYYMAEWGIEYLKVQQEKHCSNQPQTGTFIDPRDNRTYKTVTIGTQTWMAENLAYLPSVSPSSAESNTDPYYYVYGYQGTSISEAKATAHYNTYGVLYNRPAAMQSCPTGWHLPSDYEWTVLSEYLGGDSISGGKLKEIGYTHWLTPNTDATNETGFTALPGGYRYDVINYPGFFYRAHYEGYWQSAGSYIRSISYKLSKFIKYTWDSYNGFSVRCVKNE